MNFKKIELVGFKSFADKLEIKFDSGITGIVGPNGCGKSNVSDAIRWVLGEQSTKLLRSSNMQDVIFNGTERRKSMSYCEVSLFFDNTSRMFDLNFDELRDEYTALHPDILCFSSYFHGDHLQSNWACKTHAFFVGAVKDGTSDIRDPLGRILNSTTYYNRIAWARINLDRFVMHGTRNSEKWPLIRRKYKDKVLIDSHSLIGCALLYSCSDEFTAQDIAQEFNLIGYEDYFRDCRRLREHCCKNFY